MTRISHFSPGFLVESVLPQPLLGPWVTTTCLATRFDGTAEESNLK